VLFIHGYPDQWFEWRNQMVALAGSYKVLAVFQRGYNKSDKPKDIRSYDIKFLTGDIAQFCITSIASMPLLLALTGVPSWLGVSLR
jgi:pimeloyl-ACP methyl ester carboxylesterase